VFLPRRHSDNAEPARSVSPSVVQFAIGKKTSVRGDATAMEFQLQAAVEIHPEGPVIRFTCWVFHPRASNPTITC
jgi:hypothetical protein